jgi:alanyl-tRNA synthetase
LTTDELRQKFLDFFFAKGHKIYPSDTIVPKDDPTLLFTSAGMNQFKQEFLGKHTQFKRKVTCQKCLRTDDLDKVGKTNSHHTFFEMLGNFSFGDYFKEEAINFAWEFVVKDLTLPKEKIWISVYKQDDEAYKIWKDKIKVTPGRIIKLGAKENFWPANAPEEGPNGPCGPCSEIFYDQGEEIGCGRSECSPACDCGRFVEIWNLVFTQFDRKDKNILEQLPKKNIDTGMGLERMAAVLQGVANNFEIDIFKPITKQIMRLTSFNTAKLSVGQYSARNAIADHIRAITFAIADGVLPSNDERGYVVRKLIRRAVWHGKSLGVEKPYLYKLVPIVIQVMKQPYPELLKKREDIAQVVLAEERRFHKTLERAIYFAKEMIAQLRAEGKSTVGGDLAFKLYDTYGLPIEMLEVLVAANGFKLDHQGFMRELEFQRKSSRKASSMDRGVFVGTLASKYKLKATRFVGEKKFRVQTKVQTLFKQDDLVKEAKENETIKIILATTPFYGESGGQIGDSGIIKNGSLLLEVFDTQKIDQTIVHLGKVIKGTIRVNDIVQAEIDLERRKNIACNHTATHLLQAALRKVLGEHVRQAGSWVGPDKLRFDFTHFQALTKHEINRVEELVSCEIKKNKKLKVENMSFEEAQKKGALAFFGEKYQEKVRVIKIGNISLELCGGTHVAQTGEIRLFKIINETSVASGVRRIEAVTAKQAQQFLQKEQERLKELVQMFGTREEDLPEHIDKLLQKIKTLNRRLDKSRLENFKSKIGEIIAAAYKADGIRIIAQEIKNADMKLLRLMTDILRQKVSRSVVILGSAGEEKALIVCALSADLRFQGLDAAKIVRTIALDVGGTGGGRADFAQAGGGNPKGLKTALMKAREIVKKELN